MQVEYKLTVEDYLALQRFSEERQKQQQTVVGRWLSRIGNVFFAVVFFAIYGIAFFKVPESRLFFLGIVTAIVLLAFAGKAAKKRQLEKLRQQLEAAPVLFRVTLTPQSLRLESSQSKSEFAWSVVNEINEVAVYFFILYEDQALAIPRRAFPDDASASRFLEAVQERCRMETDSPPGIP